VEVRAVLTALLIMLREGFEAALVVAIVYSYIRRIDRPDLVAPMWQGMAAAAALSIGVGIVVHLTVENLSGQPRLLAFAAVSMLAVIVLTWMIFWMRSQAHRIKGELRTASTRRSPPAATSASPSWGWRSWPWPARAWRRPCS
jgi:high-affinity iron transporter